MGATQYIRQILAAIKGEIDSNTIIVGDFNTPLSSMDRSSRKKINNETQALNDTLDQMDLIDIYRAFHPNCSRLKQELATFPAKGQLVNILGFASCNYYHSVQRL